MINPSFNTSITLYHQIKEVDEEKKRNITRWERTVYKECYFGTKIAENLNGTTLAQASSYIVRIPHKNTHAKNSVGIFIVPGDVIVNGIVTDEVEDVTGKRITDIIAKYKPNCFTVRTFSDNTKIPFGAHYKATGV